MNKSLKLIAACGALAAAGAVLYGIASIMGSTVTGVGVNSQDGIWIETRQSSHTGEPLSMKEDSLTLEPFSSIRLDTDYVDVSIETSDHFGISYRIDDNCRLTHDIRDGKLTVSLAYRNTAASGMYFDNTGFYYTLFHGGFGNFPRYDSGTEKPQNTLTIYVPENTALDKLTADCDSGGFSVSGITVGGPAELTMSYGNAELYGFSAEDCLFKMNTCSLLLESSDFTSLEIKDSYGRMKLSQVDVQEKGIVRGDTCSLDIENATFGTLEYKGSYGDFTARNTTLSSFDLGLDTGHAQMKELDFTTLTADVSYGDFTLLTGKDLDSYTKDIRTEYGSIYINGMKTDDTHIVETPANPSGSLTVKGDTCDITVDAE